MSLKDIEKNYKLLLSENLNGLACVCKTTDAIQVVIHRNFIKLTQSEAYEILRYLLVACGVLLDKNHAFLEFIKYPSCNVSPLIKADVEKFKMDIRQKLKEQFLEINKEFYLRKSDLIDPNNAKFLRCAVQLANAAVNYQLKKFGINFPTDDELSKLDKNEVLNLYADVEHQGLEIKKQSESMNKIISRHQAVLESMKKDIYTLETAKVSARNEMLKIMKHCPNEIKEKQISHHEIVASWSKIMDKVHTNNLVKLNRLKNFDKNLADLLLLSDGGSKVNSIEMNISSILSPEIMEFCKNNKITILNNNRISLFSLLKILVLSIPENSRLQETSFVKLLELKTFKNNTDALFEKYKNTYNELKKELQRSASNLEGKTNSDDVNKWMATYFVPIPELHFVSITSEKNIVKSTPYIDYEILEEIQSEMN